MLEQNKMIDRRAIEEVWNGRNYDLVDELVASDFVGHASSPDQELHGPEAVKQFYMSLHSAFPDIRFTVDDQIAEGDRVVTRWTARATHRGDFQGIPATGKPGVITGVTIDRIAGGKLVECWTEMDDLGLLQQLGALPSPEQAQSTTS